MYKKLTPMAAEFGGRDASCLQQPVGTILIILLIPLLGGGRGYYGYNRYGGSGHGGALGLVLIVLLVAWLVGGVQFTHL